MFTGLFTLAMFMRIHIARAIGKRNTSALRFICAHTIDIAGMVYLMGVEIGKDPTMTRQERQELNRQASREGINKETAAEWMALARRFERLGMADRAAGARAKAASIRARFPHLSGAA